MLVSIKQQQQNCGKKSADEKIVVIHRSNLAHTHMCV